jgi:dihydrofolate reductase/mannose-6-phosphate isomerase-like protein (cupin superfamily)
MGRRTWDSIGKPLPGRKNIVLSRDPAFAPAGVVVARDLEGALAQAKALAGREVMVIGGADLYGQLLPRARRLYLTLVHHRFEGDAFFPELDWTSWKIVSREDHEQDGKNPCAYSFLVARPAAEASLPKDVRHSTRSDVPPYVTRDNSIVRELMHPAVHGNVGQSLAEALVPPRAQTKLHRHGMSEEIYYFQEGEGTMRLGDREFPVRAGDTVCIPPGAAHNVKNTGDTVLRILCACTPPYGHDDTELLD